MHNQSLILKNNKIFFEYLEKYEDKFSIKKNLLYRNKYKLTSKLKKKSRTNSFNMWYNLPFSLLIYVSDLKSFHNMCNYLYSLHDFIIIKKHRRIYKNNYNEKLITGFDCYRIYCNDFLKLYDIIEDISDYEINILGLENKGQLYPIEEISKFLNTIKEDLNFVFNILNDFNKEFNHIFQNLGELDQEFNQNLQEIFAICQHIIKSDAENE
jgi:hypothetical protein